MKYRKFHQTNQWGKKVPAGPVMNFFLNVLKWIGVT